MPPLTTLLFDFGNVLVKWDLHNIYDERFPTPEAVDVFLEEIRFFEWNSRMDRGFSFAEGVAQASEQFPQYAHLFHLLDEKWLETIREPIEDSIAIVRRLKERGYPLYILTNSSAEKFPLARQVHPFLVMFDDAIISGEIGLLKPDPAIFQYTLSRIHHTAQECLFIDDSLANIESARALGFTAIHFQSPEGLERDLKALNIL